MKVDSKSKYKLIFSTSVHPQLGVMIHPYVVAYTASNTLSLTYQKVFSGNASYYTLLTEEDLTLIGLLDDLMVETMVRKFSPVKKIRPKEFFRKHFNKLLFNEVLRPYIDKRLTEFFSKFPIKSTNLYVADEINPAAFPVRINEDFTKVLFHFRKNENGTSYFITLKHGEDRIPFMKLGGFLLTQKPARILVNGVVYKFYDFVDGAKLGVFIHKKYVHIRPESEKNYYSTFVKSLMATAPVFAQGFDIQTLKEEAVPQLSLCQSGSKFGFQLNIRYGENIFPFHQNKLFHVKLEWVDNHPKFTKYKRSQIWEANRVNALGELGLHNKSGSFFELEESTLSGCIEWIRTHNYVLEHSHFVIDASLNEKYSILKPELNYEISDKIDWFDLKVIITIGAFKLPFKDVILEMKKGGDRITLPNGEVFLFPKEWFALGNALANSSHKDGRYSIKKYQVDVLSLIKSDEIKKHLTKLVEIKKEAPHLLFKGKLRPYQIDGLSWLMFIRNNNFGGILADDMGLGKTVQTLAFLQKINHQKVKRTAPYEVFLLIAPTSLLYNWEQEAARFTPDLSVKIHAGGKRTKEPAELWEYDLVITSYGLIRNDTELFQQIDFEVVVLDESQNIKNHTAKTTQYINKLNASCRVALTGTPIENTIRDLWSQMNFLNKGLLGSLKQFETNYAKPIEKLGDKKKAIDLQNVIKPFILRRTKGEVAKDLPLMTEKTVYCEMSSEQEEYYEKVKSEYRNSIANMVEEKGLQKSKFSILQGLSKLRQIANHPCLVDNEYNSSSGKHLMLMEKISTAISDGHKVLVFSQFVRYLEVLEKDIVGKGLPLFKLTGATSKKNRAKYVSEFQETEEASVFLISLKAGGTGLNLTAADYVFIVDPWWNPAAEAQARDRTHRIGQKQSVFSYKFISRNTIEEKIITLQKKKMNYSKDIIVTENNVLANLDINQLEFLLA